MKKNAVVFLFIFLVLISVLEFFKELNILTGSRSNYVWFCCMLPFLYYSFKLCSDFHFESSYFKYAFYIFIIYQFIIFFRGLFQTNDFLSIIRSGPILWALFIPLFVFFDKSLYHIRKLFYILYILGVFFLILNIISPSLLLHRLTAQNAIPVLAIGCSFLFLNAMYLNNRKVNVAFFVLFISALSYTYLARRSAAFTLYAFILVGYFFNVFSKIRKPIFKLIPVMVIAGAFLFVIPNPFSSSLLKKIDERLFEDTRTTLFDEFYDQMDDYMIFGKGMNGTYYYPMDESIQDDGVVYSAVTYRDIIENGYLQLLLSGGIINIVLFVMVLLPAAISGIFFSSNTLTRACGIMILLWLIDMFLYGMPTLSIHYILIWICAGFCFKNSLRRKTDSQIFNELNANYYESYYANNYNKARLIK